MYIRLTYGSRYAEEAIYSHNSFTIDDDSAHVTNPFLFIL